jgi:uncharacterized protein (TIGR02231 family)
MDEQEDRAMRLFLVTTAILALVLAGWPSVSVAADAVPEHTRVDFYPQGARVIFETAPGRVHFTLPGSFGASSLRPLPLPGQKVTSFEALEVPRPGWVPDHLKDLHASIKEKEKAIARLAAKESAIKQSFNLLSGPLPRDLKGAEMAEYVEAARRVREKLETDLISIAADLNEARKELRALNADYKNLLPDGAETAVSVTATTEGGDKFLVEAWTTSASWHSFYRMNLDSESGTIYASHLARARQNTGIILTGDLHFHTTVPSTTVRPPELRPTIADFAPKTRSSRGPGAAPELGAPLEDMAPMARMAAPPKITRTLTDLSARAEGSISGDNRLREFLLGEYKLEGEVSIQAVPLLSGEAWITSEIKSIPVTILPGKVELSVDGTLSAKTDLDERGEGSDLFLAFGKIPLIKSVREKVIPKEGSTWFTGKGRIEEGYTLEVSNELAKTVQVTLKDRIPISAQEKITVETVKIKPEPSERDEKEILTWKLELEPGEKKKVEVLYIIQYPSDMDLYLR